MTQSCSTQAWRYVCVTFILAFAHISFATENVPSLEWEPNPEPYVAGYNVYIGEKSRNYTRVIDVGLETRLPLTNLNAGVTYFLAVTAYDIDRLESPFSDEVSYTPRVDGTNAVLVPCRIAVSTEAATIQIAGQPGQQCRIVATSDFQQWEEIYVTVMTEGGLFEYVDADRQGRPMRFYRVIGNP